MPRLDGYQTCALIKNNKEYTDSCHKARNYFGDMERIIRLTAAKNANDVYGHCCCRDAQFIAF
jgi:hypothetical protein